MKILIDDTGVQRYVRDVRGRFAKMGEVMSKRLRPVFRLAIVKQFATEGAWGGDPWEKLSDSRIAEKEVSGTVDRGILRDTDRLFDAFAEPGSPDFDVVFAGRGQFTYVIGVPYAFRHQEGTGRLPIRQVVPDPMPDSFIAELRNIVSGYIVGAELVSGEDGEEE